ncbi:hypothetical protein DL96DRAFT_1684434 [Flagelloscypha sp. PMI_526]|nr:hypothetical protein DL96DRAFT_1684434 [Flagelloscypha sp. PMI_526]
MSLGPASLRLAAVRSIIPLIPEVPREFVDLKDRSRKQDSLFDFLGFDKRDIEDVDARQVGYFDLGKLLAEQLKPNVRREPADLKERTNGLGPLFKFPKFSKFGDRDSEEVDIRQLGSFNLPHLVASSLAGRQIGSFDLPGLLAYLFTKEAQTDSANSTLRLNRDLAKELEEGIDHVVRMIARELKHTLD